jgi:hypothetical protein
MGVFASYCQVCALPVQHDHYVPMNGMYYINRGKPEDPNFVVRFGPEHAWLKDALALRLNEEQEPILLEGEIHDGGIERPSGEGDGEEAAYDFEDAFVADGVEERAALHRVCWELAGKPQTWAHPSELEAPAELRPYRHQLFQFKELMEAGSGWMLVDPRLDSADGRRSRERILALLAHPREG